MTTTRTDALPAGSSVAPVPTARRCRGGAVDRLEAPTLGIVMLVYGGFFLVTFFFHDLPLWVAAVLGTVLLSLHGSLQHEIIHGHPTPYRRLNNMLATPPLALWIPYELYRESHLRHHRHSGRYLTDPVRDPESFYVEPSVFALLGGLRRAMYRAHRTLAGRMLLGPAFSLCAFWSSESGKVWAGHRHHISIWVRHGLKVSLVLTWTVGVCRIPLLVYLALMVYPSVSLTQLRSFAEHRYDVDPRLRTVVVEAGRLLSFIFLNNNLHIVHHVHPRLSWYELPDTWRQMRAPLVNSGLVVQGGYREIVRRHLWKPVIAVEHPRLQGPARPV